MSKKLRCFLKKFTQLTKILHDRRSRRSRQIPSLILICMNTYLVKGPLIELSLGGKKEEKKGKWKKKKKWGTIVSVSRGNKWWSATLGRSYWMHHPAWPPICSSCDENIWWGYYFLSTIIIVKEIDSSHIIFKGFEVAWCSSSSSWGLGRWATLDIHNWTGPLPPPPPPSFISNRQRRRMTSDHQDWWGLRKHGKDGDDQWSGVDDPRPASYPYDDWWRSLGFGWTKI